MRRTVLNDFWLRMNLALRLFFFILIVSFGVVTLIMNAREALAASLKDISIVKSEMLTLGDIFDGLKTNADYVIGPAPQPGNDMVLNARTLYRIAVAMDLPWRPASTGQQVIIRREATLIPYSVLENELKDSLKAKGVDGKFSIDLTAGQKEIVLPDGNPQRVEISAFKFDPQKDLFNATVYAPSKDKPIKQFHVTGFVERIADVPVLRNALRNGDVIGAADIDWIQIPHKKLQHDLIMNAEDMIGLTPRRIAHAGKPLIETELERPQLIERGDNITLIFQEGTLTLTAKGKALQAGAKGDLIRVSNLGSSRSIQGTVSGDGVVIVQ